MRMITYDGVDKPNKNEKQVVENKNNLSVTDSKKESSVSEEIVTVLNKFDNRDKLLDLLKKSQFMSATCFLGQLSLEEVLYYFPHRLFYFIKSVYKDGKETYSFAGIDSYAGAWKEIARVKAAAKANEKKKVVDKGTYLLLQRSNRR